MFNVFIALCASLISSHIVNSDIFQLNLYNYDYKVYIVSRAFVYLALASFCVKLSIKSLDSRNNFSAMLIGVLSLSLVITAILQLLMVIDGAYVVINQLKSGSGFSWRSIYSSIEILIGLIVGGNGFNYLAHVDICPYGKRNAIMGHNPNSDQSKQQ